MSKIKLLEQNLINQIAAGEVVERPVSVVKELVENSLDAGARSITVEIIDGGKKLIKVIDDGEGISKEDLPLALQRHATSKLRSQEDLFRIATMGFRGEALPSIASVSRMVIVSKTKDSLENHGYTLNLAASIVQGIEPSAANLGTTIEIHDLFFNIPARLKFLKSASTEVGHIQEFLIRAMLAHPEVSFSFINEGAVVLKTNGQNVDPVLGLRNVIAETFSPAIAKAMQRVDLQFADSGVSGFVSGVHLLSAQRTHQLFFVNGRPIVAPMLNKAIDAAISDIVPHGKYPYAILFIHLPYAQVDVNVHPAKREVRFAQGQQVFELVRNAVRRAYADRPMQESMPAIKTFMSTASVDNSRFSSFSPLPEIQQDLKLDLSQTFMPLRETQSLVSFDARMPNVIILGQIYRLFVLLLDGDDFLLIDQHAAHERILYEKMQAQDRVVQELLLPVKVQVMPAWKSALHDNNAILTKLGFNWEWFGDDVVLLRSVPLIHEKTAYHTLFADILDALTTEQYAPDQIEQKIIATISCKAAIKDGDLLDQREMEQLVRDLYATPRFQTCPHGRPTIIALTKEELFKRFKRT